jgi:predicted GTPase
VVVVNKVDTASAGAVAHAVEAVQAVNASAPVVRGRLPVRLDDPDAVRGRRVLVVEDGPTITHGSMPYGAGFVAAEAAGAAVIVDARRFVTGELRDVFARYPHIGPVLPSVGYDSAQRAALGETIDRSDAHVVVAATPVDLARLIAPLKPIVRARYDFADGDDPALATLVDRWIAQAPQRR